MMGPSMELTLLLVVAATLWRKDFVAGGCSGKCCPGTDLSCAATGWRMDRVYGTCFCDENCVRTKDCCFDYPTECPAQSCVVSQWSYWSGCAQPCELSLRIRRRNIAQEPRNSQEPCPSLEQRAGCREYRDLQGQHCGQNAGPAFITSIEFGEGRPKSDKYGTPLNPGFCMEYTMLSRTPHCTVENRPHTHWMRYLTEGFKVCVACQPPAIRNHTGSCQGDGQESNKETMLSWQAVGNPRCSGTWRKILRTQYCSCPPQHSFLFI